MGKKLNSILVDSNNCSINEAYNAIAHPHKFNAFVSVKYLDDYTPAHNIKTEAGILLDSLRYGIWIDFSGFEDRYYSEYSADYQVFSCSEDIITIKCESKYGDRILITITPDK